MEELDLACLRCGEVASSLLEVCRKMEELDLACLRCVGKLRVCILIAWSVTESGGVELACLKCVGKWRVWILMAWSV